MMSIHKYQHLLYLVGSVSLLLAIGHYLYTHKDGIISLEAWHGDEIPGTSIDTNELPGYDLVEDSQFDPVEGLPSIPSASPTESANYDPDKGTETDPTKGIPISKPGPVELVPALDETLMISDFAPAKTHRVLYSRSTADKKYFKINSRDHSIYNANILPHPEHDHSWIVIGQRITPSYHFSELYCEAIFLRDELYCIKNPLTLSIGSAPSFGCNGTMALMGFSVGPRDARAFYGPEFPMVTYGAKSHYTCLGQHAADLRSLMDWKVEYFDPDKFRVQTELQRPPPFGAYEKNWFLWWDTKGDMYAHYDLEPRSFAKIEYDGSAGPNLATTVSAAAAKDQLCIDRFVPRTTMNENDAVHQSTNSLAITFCNRSDPACKPTPANTHVMAIFQHKICPGIHSVYEPYVVLFQQDAPFSLIGISTKPLWIYGRLQPGEHDDTYPEKFRPDDESEMMYVTSMSWKKHGHKFHGYLDDEIFLSFGIEDTHAGGIDVLASDILKDIGYCANVKKVNA